MIGVSTKRFKGVRETYKINTFLMTMGLMYPNPKYDDKRKKLIICVILSVIPALGIIGYDMRLRILHNDMPNLVRQSIVSVSMLFVLVKLILTLLRKKELRALFDDIDKDYELFNDLPEEYQNIVEETIQKTKKIEKAWFIIMVITASSYPILAGLCTMYSQLFSENPQRFMVHETSVVLLTEEEKYETPYFELMNVYIMYIVIFIFIGFIGFDGMFSVCMLHVSLKLKIYNQNLKNLLNNIDINRNIAAFVDNHCEAERLMGEIQKCFEVWLVGIFFNAILQLGMTLIQITNTTETDINQMYFLFALATVVHIYLPCYLASEITSNVRCIALFAADFRTVWLKRFIFFTQAAEIANVAYCCSWERVQDEGMRKSICIIIAKAQIPICLRALGMITFNMEMFVSILQTAYSMYTLLRK